MTSPVDMNGTPFVFAAWLTGIRDGLPVGRIIDKDPFEITPSYCMESADMLLLGVEPCAAGSVLLADRAHLCAVMGQEAFNVEGANWTIGIAATEDEALGLIGDSVRPGEWADPRAYLHDIPHEEHVNSF